VREQELACERVVDVDGERPLVIQHDPPPSERLREDAHIDSMVPQAVRQDNPDAPLADPSGLRAGPDQPVKGELEVPDEPAKVGQAIASHGGHPRGLFCFPEPAEPLRSPGTMLP
jgi:hypothetical protein